MKKKNRLLSNTIMLYILTFSVYVLGFITNPIQTRVFGNSGPYGALAFVASFATYFKVFLDFGFLLSATEEVSRFRDDRIKICKIFTSVFISKIFLVLISAAVFTSLFYFIAPLREDPLLYTLYFIDTVIFAFLPDFLYRGLEDMKVITFRSVAIKILSTVLIIIFLREPDQYYLIPIFNIIGSLLSVVAVYYDVWKRLKVRFIKVSFHEVYTTLKYSSTFFLSRAATTVTGATNTVVAGMFYAPKSVPLSLYSSADKLISTAKSGFSPISDSLYPYMVENKDFKLVKKIFLILMPIIIVGSVGVGFFAKDICALIFGSDYRDAGTLLQFLMPIIVITLPNYVLGFPTLVPMGLAKHANYSVIVGAFVQLALLITLAVLNIFSIYSLCIITVISEFSTFLYRLIIVLVHRKSFK